MFGVPSIALIPEEHRLHRRYPIRLHVHYKLLDREVVTQTGTGRTVNISAQGILFEGDHPLPDRGDIVLELAWPALLDGVRRLKLVVYGGIVRSEGTAIAVRFKVYDFHTKRSRK
jgi:hypothetical protein